MANPQIPDIARLFHLNSSNTRSKAVNYTVDFDRRPLSFRTYPGSTRVPLPGRDHDLGAATLGELIESRRSLRDFTLGPLPLETVGRLLFAAYGVRGTRTVGSESTYDRPTPSAGALYPLELYVAAQQVEGLADGIYHYDARAHELELRRPGVVHDQLTAMTIGQEMIRSANLVVIIAAVVERTMWKYGQRGYRYVWLDAGHTGQNLYLAAAALGLGPVAVGGFFDEEINRLVGLSAGEEEAIYLVCIGQPR